MLLMERLPILQGARPSKLRAGDHLYDCLHRRYGRVRRGCGYVVNEAALSTYPQPQQQQKIALIG
jgi:hypothetical protein